MLLRGSCLGAALLAAAAAGDADCHVGSDAGSEQCTDELGRFLEWLEEGGATIHPSLTVRPGEGGMRGLHATGVVEEGAELARVPRNLWLDEATALKSDELGKLLTTVKEQAKGMPEHVPLLIYLVAERLKGADSFWHPYFQWLPDLRSLPMAFSPAQRAKLIASAPPALINQLVDISWHDADLEFEMLKTRVFDPRPALFRQAPPGGGNVLVPQRLRAAFDWAYNALYSRTISREVGHFTAMIPFVDTPNHVNVDEENHAGPSGLFDVEALVS